ncbi:hypothetical protein HOF65_02045 [bacterium]|nr:hypothetical protein [bacterium]MBT3852789.1 hypothetical protein [bacterium]
MIREHRNKIKHFNIAFREIINILDTDELLDLINDEEINKEFFDINKDVFSSIRKLIDDFLAPPRNTIAKPFKGFYHRLSGCKIKINDSIKKQDSI